MSAVRYIVADVEASVAFYTGRLGFTLVQKFGPAMAIVERAGLRLWLAGPPASASQPMPDGRRPAPGGWNRIVVEVRDIEAMVAALKTHGVVLRNDIVTGPGGRQVLIEDPSGNPVELFEAR